MATLSRRDFVGAATGVFFGAVVVETVRRADVTAASLESTSRNKTGIWQQGEIQESLLGSIPETAENEVVLAKFSVHCMKGHINRDIIAFCDDPVQYQSIALSALDPSIQSELTAP